MLDLSQELFTSICPAARISGWCAHRIEELATAGKIIRPAGKSVAKQKYYMPMDERG